MQYTTDRFVPALGYSRFTRLYDPVVSPTTRERTFKQQLLRQANAADGHDVLDLACGTGTLSMWLKQTVPGARVTGLDADAQVLAAAERKARATVRP